MGHETFVVPDAIAALGPEVTQQVERLVAGAERRHGEEMQQAAVSSLRIVPRPLRPLAKRMLGL